MKDLRYFWLLSRPLNVGIAALVFTLACLIAQKWDFLILENRDFQGTLLALIGVMAGGYWVNDVFDFKIDRINKPEKVIVNSFVSSKKVLTVYFVSQVIILGIVFFSLPLRVFIFSATSAFVLLVYAAWLKRISVLGNLLISTLTASVIWLAMSLFGIRWPLIWLSMFAFEITFLRELTKDIEDIKGDLKFGLKTLPIQMGIRSVKKLLLFAYLVFILSAWVPLVSEYLRTNEINYNYLMFSLILIQFPAFFILKKTMRSSKPQDFASPSFYLKLMIGAGILAVLWLK